MLTAYFDVRGAKSDRWPAAPPRPPPKASASSGGKTAAARRGKQPKPTEAATTSVLAKFEPLAPERKFEPKAAELPGRQEWQGLTDGEVKCDDEMADWETAFMVEGEEEAEAVDDDDVSEPDYEADSLDVDDVCAGASAEFEPSSSSDEAMGGSMGSLKAALSARRQRAAAAAAPRQKAVYAGPLLCCDQDDDDDFDV